MFGLLTIAFDGTIYPEYLILLLLLTEMYGKDGSIPATFQVIYMIGWKPDPKQVGCVEKKNI